MTANPDSASVEVTLRRVGTVRVKHDRRCDVCGAQPDAALRTAGQIQVYCWPCLRAIGATGRHLT